MYDEPSPQLSGTRAQSGILGQMIICFSFKKLLDLFPNQQCRRTHSSHPHHHLASLVFLKCSHSGESSELGITWWF